MNSADLNQSIRESTNDTAILSFSCGKDSIAAWLELRRYFTRIVPYYLYPVPGLEFVETSLAYYEAFFGTRIIRLPHPSLYRQLNNLVFQPPTSRIPIEDAELGTFTYDHVNEIVRQDCGLDPSTYVAVGVRAADSVIRGATLRRCGPVNHARKTWYPVYDWNKDRVISEIQAAGVRLPVDYRIFGMSFDGIDFRFLKPLKQHFPRDYQRILEFFPLAEVELVRAAYRDGERYVA